MRERERECVCEREILLILPDICTLNMRKHRRSYQKDSVREISANKEDGVRGIKRGGEKCREKRAC